MKDGLKQPILEIREGCRRSCRQAPDFPQNPPSNRPQATPDATIWPGSCLSCPTLAREPRPQGRAISTPLGPLFISLFVSEAPYSTGKIFFIST